MCAAEFFIGSAFGSSSRGDVCCKAFRALAGVGGGEGYSSEVFTAFTDCLRTRGLRLQRPSHTVRAYSSCFKHDAASFTQRLRAERVAAAAVAEVRGQMRPSSGSGGCARESASHYTKEIWILHGQGGDLPSLTGAAGTAKVS